MFYYCCRRFFFFFPNLLLAVCPGWQEYIVRWLNKNKSSSFKIHFYETIPTQGSLSRQLAQTELRLTSARALLFSAYEMRLLLSLYICYIYEGSGGKQKTVQLHLAINYGSGSVILESVAQWSQISFFSFSNISLKLNNWIYRYMPADFYAFFSVLAFKYIYIFLLQYHGQKSVVTCLEAFVWHRWVVVGWSGRMLTMLPPGCSFTALEMQLHHR